MHVLTIDNLNARAQSFEAQFYFYLTWYGARNPDGLEFTNGKDVQRLIQVQQSDSVGTTLSCRARGTFRSQMDFSDYPMDRHTLRIEIEDFNYTEDELGYRIDKANTGVSPDVSLDGWAIGQIKPEVTSKPFGSANQRFSHYEYTIAIRRLLTPFIIRIFLPLIIVVAMSMVTFYIPENQLEPQISIGATSILSIIALHFVIRDQLPDVGYLTKADFLMILSYFTIFLTLVESVLVHVIHTAGRPQDSRAIDRRCRVMFPVGYVIGVLVIALV